MSSTVEYLRALADQIEKGVTICIDIDIAPDEIVLNTNMHLHLTYRSLAASTDAAGLAKHAP